MDRSLFGIFVPNENRSFFMTIMDLFWLRNRICFESCRGRSCRSQACGARAAALTCKVFRYWNPKSTAWSVTVFGTDEEMARRGPLPAARSPSEGGCENVTLPTASCSREFTGMMIPPALGGAAERIADEQLGCQGRFEAAFFGVYRQLVTVLRETTPVRVRTGLTV